MSIKLSIGRVAFPIEFDNGDKDCIYFNPNDPDLASRLMKSQDNITKKIEQMKYEDFEIDNSGDVTLPDNLEGLENLTEEQVDEVFKKAKNATMVIEETKNIIMEEIDTAFGGDISSVVFKHCSPLAVVNGEYFILQFLNAITPEIQKHIGKSNKELEKKMSKHISKYAKK